MWPIEKGAAEESLSSHHIDSERKIKRRPKAGNQ